jgi:hypothetical protein
MPTALAIINRAAEIIGYKDPDEALGGTDAANFLGVLNSMLDSWNTQRLFIVSVQEVVQNVSGLPITIGPSGTIVMARPVRMEDGAFIRLNGADFGITWVERVEYDSIVQKAQPGDLACYGYYEPALPDGRIYLWPFPQTAVELHLQLMTQLTAFANLATNYVLAPGYQRALEYSLAEELAPGRRPLTPDVMRQAANARRVIRRLNVEVPLQSFVPNGPNPYAAFIAGLM